jgi:hypothetical protein
LAGTDSAALAVTSFDRLAHAELAAQRVQSRRRSAITRPPAARYATSRTAAAVLGPWAYLDEPAGPRCPARLRKRAVRAGFTWD